MALNLRKKQSVDQQQAEFIRAKRRRQFSAPLTFLIVVAAIIFAMSVFFRVSVIDVVGNTHYTDEEIISAIDIEKGDNLFFFDRFATISRVFAKLPYVEQVSVKRSLPNKVSITVEESEALAYLVVGDEEWTLDDSCKILGKATEDELDVLIPIVGISPGTLMIGEQLLSADGDEAIIDYLSEVLYQMQERGIYPLVRRVDFSDKNHVKFSYDGKYTVLLGDSYNTEYKFGMFVSVVDKLKEGDVGTIDLSNATSAIFTPN